MNIPELLAPVGSKEALAAAVQNGADAVYFGGKVFSARQYASNFDREELAEAIKYAHIRGVKVYVTVNTLLADSELAEAADYLRFLYEAGVNAIIVQDLGVVRLCQMLLPELEIHASTQMTVHNSSGAVLLQQLGFKRIVLARELSLEEITEVKRKTGVETEVFVHGALCVCYSGQCLMSSMIGGRSGNRGRCAQPCRMEYSLVDSKGNSLVNTKQVGSHLLSPKDLNMLKYLPEIAQAGVCSLKIEGRMKRPEYVAIVTSIYREALDRLREASQDYSVTDRETKDLAQIFNRGFTTGYFFGKQGQDLMSYKRPNNRGLRLGRVTKSDWFRGMVELLLEDDLRIGDGVEFWITEGGRKGISVSNLLIDDQQVEKALAGQKVWISAEGRIKPGDRVFKTHDAELIARAERSYQSSREKKKIPLEFKVRAIISKPIEITVSDHQGRSFSVTGDFPAQEAVNKPMTEDALLAQLNRLGNTPFAVGKLEAEIQPNVMVPVSEINEIRRKAVSGLAEMRAVAYVPARIPHVEFTEKKDALFQHQDFKPNYDLEKAAEIKLIVKAQNLTQVQAAAENRADLIYFGGSDLSFNEKETLRKLDDGLELCLKHKVRLVISFPRIVKEDELKQIRSLLDYARSQKLPVMAGSLGILREAMEKGIEQIHADYSLNIFNNQALSLLIENYHIAQAVLSPELTFSQLALIARPSPVPIETIVQGSLPLMVTEYCLLGSLVGGLGTNSCCTMPCKKFKEIGIKDRMGYVFPVMMDGFCRNSINNTKELCMIEDIIPLFKAGVRGFRLELSGEDTARVEETVGIWRKEIDRFINNPDHYESDMKAKERMAAGSIAGLTKGHYYRGVE
jgi:putative protease